MVLAFWKTWPRPGMSISFPAASQHLDVFNTQNEMRRCLLVIQYRSLTLHLEKILIVFQHIVKLWKANLMILVCFSDRMNSHRRKFKVWRCYSSFGLCLAGMHCYNWKHGHTKTDGGDNALNLQPQRRECKGWSRIELRILDSRRLQKASIWGGKSLSASLQMFVNYFSSPGEAAQTCCRDSLKSVNWQRGSSNQMAARPLYSCSRLLLHPHFFPCSDSSPSHSLSFFYLMLTVFKDLSFVLWKSCKTQMPICEEDLFLER